MTKIVRLVSAVFGPMLVLSSIQVKAVEPTLPEAVLNPFDRQVPEQVENLDSSSANVRAGAAEALAYLRAYSAADTLANALGDQEVAVRREAAMALAWCGGRGEVPRLIRAMEDDDWVVRQAAWVSLTNLTGMEWPFDATGASQQRARQAAVWRDWWAEGSKQFPPKDVLKLLDDENLECRLRAVRALGALGGPDASKAILKTIRPYCDADYGKPTPLERHLVQAGLRSLGRLREPEAFEPLLGFFKNVGWARYAADALGEFGDRRAVEPLVAAYPDYAWGMKREVPKLFPRDDNSSSGMSPEDRMYETPYAISVALARLPLNDSQDKAALRRIAAYLAANMPSDWDGGMIYEPESFEAITAWLLDRAGLRRTACEAAFTAAQMLTDNPEMPLSGSPAEDLTPEQNLLEIAKRSTRDVPWFAGWLPALCRDQEDVPRLIELLKHDNGWVRINAVKALMFIGARETAEPLAAILAASKTEAEWGYSGVLEHAEYNDPAPRWREAFVRALGRLGDGKHSPLLIKILEDDRNVLEVRHAAAAALDELGTPEAVAALRRTEADHPFHSVRMVAREALWRRGLKANAPSIFSGMPTSGPAKMPAKSAGLPLKGKNQLDAIVFIKGENKVHSDFNAQSGLDPFRQTYSITNSGPTYRRGRNLYILRSAKGGAKVTQLTHFKDGYVSNLDVSWDGRCVIFAYRADGDTRCSIDVGRQERSRQKLEHEPKPGSDPWWHIWEINADGTGLRQLTFGPYHDVQPAYLPDGRIVFSSSRIGLRDEYHGYPCTGLSTMDSNGGDIRTIGFNLGGDREPAVMPDGRIVYSRLDLFYSRLKTEFTVQAVFPDGHGCVTLYGPERREFWKSLNREFGEQGWSESPPRHRVLRLTQPRPLDEGRVICASSAGLTIIGPGRHQEKIVPHDKSLAVTCPYPLDDGRILCAATEKKFKQDKRHVAHAAEVDLGLYLMDLETGKTSLLYNDPKAADFEARPIAPRRPPPVRHETPPNNSFTARLACNSVYNTQHRRVQTRGRFIRVVEGMPIVSRHQTQQNHPGNRWRNHGGTHARVLGTVPLAADGSFFAEVPADRLLHLQVLDADRQVVGNQLIWMYVRPGETRGCIGCHERPNSTQLTDHYPLAASVEPVRLLPTGGEFTYRAKAWRKGILPDEAEERGRTVRAVSLIGRQ